MSIDVRFPFSIRLNYSTQSRISKISSTDDYLIFVFCLRVVYSAGVYFSPSYKRYCFASCATIDGYGVKESTYALDITKGIFSPGAKLGISILYTSNTLSVRLAS